MPAGPQVGGGNCTAPELVAGTSNTYMTECISPGFPMKPGDVINSFYEMPMPYPSNALVTILDQQASIIDSTRRQVPLSEIYVHHFFGDARNFRAEVCGSLLASVPAHHLFLAEAVACVCMYGFAAFYVEL
jgi:Stress up-regulated Nod 19